ncbi:peptidoglycan binding domain-containing protein [Streptomyces wuyuanensis]|uniref:Peptidoglycan binding domain-containing protein n=1 Tax=Streptomyces wuyuanensis TaxID=1196353 RepID=A0A1G9P5S7_9ACTN|nr:hypothetical protein [Streptomyces wuyuanensis]SDL93535.1 hypothetical protein SAMN05444921_102283 [Streptomyces wuyuanensis]
MSRETDSSSSGPQGRGGAAYPSGTPPYGSRQYPSLHPTQDAPEERAEPASARQSDEPRTETTLTTRIRINIPGSRPIPPVVMRTPMSDLDKKGAPAPRQGAAERTGSTPRPPAPAQSAPAAADAARNAGAPEAPEKPAEEKTSDWFAPRKAPSPTPPPASVPAQATGPGQGPNAVPGPRPEDTGAHRMPGAPAPRNGQAPGAQGAGNRPRSGLDALSADLDAPGRTAPGQRPAGAGPAGPTTGPAAGTSPFAPGAPAARVPGAGAPGGGPAGPPRMSDDTAVLTPQKPAPEHGAGGPGSPGGNVSGDTLTSGIPVVPPEHRSPFQPGGPDGAASPWPSGPGGAGPDISAPDFPGPAAAAGTPGAPPARPSSSTAPAPSGPAKKGRSKAVLAGAGVFGLLVVAYGAGLLLNHSEVPKGTTVLGVDIGGGTKEDAQARLEAALGKRATSPLQLSVGGQKVQLAPDKAGLSLDSQATVREAAGSDYNPVSVIGSLFGGERVAQPVIPVDEEKLGVALTDLAGTSGSASEGTIRFEPGKVVPVPGKAGKTLDVRQSMISVRDAYRAQVETGRVNNVELPVATREPTITQTELNRAMKEFAEPAMSDLVTIKAGGKEIQFGPARSLPKILSMKAVDGRLVEVYNKQAITELLDGVFDGIMVTKGDGKQYPLSADDVASAMQKALLGKTPEERTQTIELDGQG